MLISPYHNSKLWAVHEFHKPWENPCLHHNLDAIIAAISQVGNSPAGVRDDSLVFMLQEEDEDWQNLLHSIQGRAGVLVPAQV